MLVSRHRGDQRLVAKYITAGISCDSIVRTATWLRQFLRFVTRLDWAKGRLVPRAKTFNDKYVYILRPLFLHNTMFGCVCLQAL